MTNLARGEPGVSGGPTSQTIHIYNFVDDIDLSDEFEVRETVSELRSLLQPIGLIAEIRVMLSTSDHAGISALASVTFCDESSAANAIGVICGLVCGGRTLIASHGDIAALSDNQSSTATNTSAPTALKAMAYDAHPDVAVYLHKLISSDTLDDADEVHEVIGEVKGLCQVFGGVNSVWIESREEEVLLCQERAQDSADGATASLLPWGIVVYSDIGAGMCAVQLLDGRAVAGSYLSAALLDWDAFERNEFMDSELIDISEKKTDSDVRYSIRLCGFATEEEVASEEERAEVTDNVVSIFLEVGQQVSRDDVIISRSIRSERAGEPSSAVVDIIVVLPSLQMCCDLRKRIGTIVIGGVVAQVDIVQLPDGAPASEQQDQQQQVIRARRCLCSRTGAAVVVVRNFFVEEDLLGDNEELAVMKRDLLDLATDTAESTTAANGRGASSVDQGYVQRIYIYSQGDHSEELATYSETLYAEHGGGEEQEGREQHEKEEEEGGNECAASYVVGITFADPFAAQEALLHLDQRIVAGISLKAQIEPYQATAVVSAITSTRHVVAQEYFGSTEIAETASAEGVIRCLEGIDKSEGDFVCIYSELFASASTTAVTEEGGAEHVTTGGTVGKGAGGTPSKFGEAVALPKLSPHDAPRLSIPVRIYFFLHFFFQMIFD